MGEFDKEFYTGSAAAQLADGSTVRDRGRKTLVGKCVRAVPKLSRPVQHSTRVYCRHVGHLASKADLRTKKNSCAGNRVAGTLQQNLHALLDSSESFASSTAWTAMSRVTVGNCRRNSPRERPPSR